VDSAEGHSEVLGEQWVVETSTADLNLSVWRVSCPWANWSLPWRGSRDDWAVSVSSSAWHKLGLVGVNSVEEEGHRGGLTKVSVGTKTVAWGQSKVGCVCGPCGGTRHRQSRVLLPVAGALASNAPPCLDCLSVPVHIIETLAADGHGDVSTQVTKGRSDRSAVWAIVEGRGVWRVGSARSLERVQHLSVFVEGISGGIASERGLCTDGHRRSRLPRNVVPGANGGSESYGSGTSDLDTSNGNRGGNRPGASRGSQRRTVDPWTPPPVEANTNTDLVRRWQAPGVRKGDGHRRVGVASSAGNRGTGDQVVIHDVDRVSLAQVVGPSVDNVDLGVVVVPEGTSSDANRISTVDVANSR